MPADASPTQTNGRFADQWPSMHGRYLVHSPRLIRLLDLCDALLSRRSIPSPPVPRHIDRILLANWGHLGDVITTFGVIAALRARYPGVLIGMIVGSWGQKAIEHAGLVDRLHVVDHLLLDRSDRPKLAKLRAYARSRHRALADIRAVGYQVALDLNPFFPPAHPLFHAASIPVRIGYDSGGFGALLSTRVTWPDLDRPMAEHHHALLDALNPDFSAGTLQPSLPAPPPADFGRYLVLHPGAGAPFKDWGLEHWTQLARSLHIAFPAHRLVVTGAGPREAGMAGDLERAGPPLTNLVDKLSWAGFVAVIASAELVICPDTATGHVAALFDTPTIALFTGVNNPAQWAPYSHQAQVLRHPVACAPCHRPAGCEAMACLRHITPKQVLDAARTALDPAGRRPPGSG